MNAVLDKAGAVSERLHAEPEKRIMCKTCGRLVGWLYRWDTGEVSLMWRNEPIENVVYARFTASVTCDVDAH